MFLLVVTLLSLFSVSLSQQNDYLSLLILGDWGAPITSDNIANIASQCELDRIQGILAIGDNFYERGVSGLSDPQWVRTFENVYTQPVFHQRWYVVAGNHDHYGNVTAQLSYTQLSNRWYFPSLYYTVMFNATPTETVLFVFIDTVTLTERGDVQQLNWIEETLNSSKADWIVVVGHYPVFSTGGHGTNAFLLSKVLPMFEKYGVAAYIAGHDHGLQYIKYNTVSYVVSGNIAKFADQSANVLPAGPVSQFKWPDNLGKIALCQIAPLECLGYSNIKFSEKGLSLSFYATSNNILMWEDTLQNPRSTMNGN